MKFKEKRIYKNIPKGWKIEENANNHPAGTKWLTNGKSRFSKSKPERKTALLVTDEKRMIEHIAKNRRTGKTDGFKTDKFTETKVQAEIKRQNRASAKKLTTKPVRKTTTCKPTKKK